MDEQEKKTFKYLKSVYNLNFKMCSFEKCDIKNIVNIIEKQQKEIEDLKTITREYEAYELGEGNKIIIASKEWFADGFFINFLSNYVSKDKIKEVKAKWDKSIAWANADDYNYAMKMLEDLIY